MIQRIEELATQQKLELLGPRHVLDRRKVQVIHTVGAQCPELRGECAQVACKLQRRVAVEARRVESLIDTAWIRMQVATQIDHVAPGKRRTGLRRLNRIERPSANYAAEDRSRARPDSSPFAEGQVPVQTEH